MNFEQPVQLEIHRTPRRPALRPGEGWGAWVGYPYPGEPQQTVRGANQSDRSVVRALCALHALHAARALAGS